MWFKSLHLYRVHDAVILALPVLGEALQGQVFRLLGGIEARRIGWAAPAGRGSDAFVHEVNGQRLLSAQRQERLLPATVVKKEVKARAAERGETEGHPLRRQEKHHVDDNNY